MMRNTGDDYVRRKQQPSLYYQRGLVMQQLLPPDAGDKLGKDNRRDRPLVTLGLPVDEVKQRCGDRTVW